MGLRLLSIIAFSSTLAVNLRSSTALSSHRADFQEPVEDTLDDMSDESILEFSQTLDGAKDEPEPEAKKEPPKPPPAKPEKVAPLDEYSAMLAYT